MAATAAIMKSVRSRVRAVISRPLARRRKRENRACPAQPEEIAIERRGRGPLARAVGGGYFPHQLSWRIDNPFRRLFLTPAVFADRLSLSESSRVLEVGPGPGCFSAELAERISRGHLELLDLQPQVRAQVVDIVIDIYYQLEMPDKKRGLWTISHSKGSYDHPGPHLFQEIVRAHQALIGVFSLEVGMSSARMCVLRQLADSDDGSLGVVDLARALGVTPAIVTRQVQEFEAEGLLRRRSDSRDRRRSQLYLTARGRRTFAQLHERAHELQTRVLDGLRDEEVAAACHVLHSLRTAIETEPHGSRD